MKKNILGIAEFLFAAVLTIGSFTVFKACGEHEGKFMACHWAQNAVTLIGAVTAILALVRIILKNTGIKAGIAIGISLLSAAVIIIPGHVISLCMMETMRCHSIFRPAVTVIGALLVIIAVIDAAAGIIKSGKES